MSPVPNREWKTELRDIGPAFVYGAATNNETFTQVGPEPGVTYSGKHKNNWPEDHNS